MELLCSLTIQNSQSNSKMQASSKVAQVVKVVDYHTRIKVHSTTTTTIRTPQAIAKLWFWTKVYLKILRAALALTRNISDQLTSTSDLIQYNQVPTIKSYRSLANSIRLWSVAHQINWTTPRVISNSNRLTIDHQTMEHSHSATVYLSV